MDRLNNVVSMSPASEDAPEISELDALKLEVALLRGEATQQALQLLALSIAKPGYRVQRTGDGRWSYVRTS